MISFAAQRCGCQRSVYQVLHNHAASIEASWQLPQRSQSGQLATECSIPTGGEQENGD
jgi:hypothetical protein